MLNTTYGKFGEPPPTSYFTMMMFYHRLTIDNYERKIKQHGPIHGEQYIKGCERRRRIAFQQLIAWQLMGFKDGRDTVQETT